MLVVKPLCNNRQVLGEKIASQDAYALMGFVVLGVTSGLAGAIEPKTQEPEHSTLLTPDS